MTEILFYHLERVSFERVLPDLLEKSLTRGWRAVVQAASEERVEALDQHLWTYREETFLPHGSGEDGHSELQPVFLTSAEDNPNKADIRFFVDGAQPSSDMDLNAYTRIVHLFDGGDEASLAGARELWKQAADGTHDVTYWQQSESGGWEKKT